MNNQPHNFLEFDDHDHKLNDNGLTIEALDSEPSDENFYNQPQTNHER